MSPEEHHNAVDRAIYDLAMLGAIVEALGAARRECAYSAIPADWVMWIGHQIVRLAEDATHHLEASSA